MNISLGPKQLVGSFQYFRDGSDRPAVHSTPMVIDIDGDGVDEIILAGLETQPNTPEEFSHVNVHIFGWEDGQFRNLTDKWLPSGAGEVYGVGEVVAGDFNGNGLTDLFLTAYADMDHYFSPFVLMNQGGYFIKEALPIKASWQHGAGVADINGDGYDDVIAAGYGIKLNPDPNDNQFDFSDALYLGGPDGLTEVYSEFAFGSDIVLGDFLGKGEIEAIIVDYGPAFGKDDTVLGRFQFDETGVVNFENIRFLPTPPLENFLKGGGLSHDVRVIAEDFNADGQLDVIVYSVEWWNGFEWPTNTAIQFLQNQGDGNFIDVTSKVLIGFDNFSTAPSHPQGLRDFNQDGLKDLYIGAYTTWGKETFPSSLLMQNTEGQFVDTGRTELSSELHPFASFGSSSAIAKGGDGQFYQIILDSKPLISDVSSRLITFPDRDLDETLIGTPLSDKIWGMGGNDQIIATAGDDWIDGGDGIDTVVYSANKSNFVITFNDEGFTVTDKINTFGTDTLISVERLEFQDAYIALDLEGPDSAGAVYRLYQAALGRTPDKEGLGYWIDAMDKGLNLTGMANSFINSAEFIRSFGDAIDNKSFVSLLYNNILGREPEQAGFDYWVDVLDKGHSRHEILPGFSESTENQLKVIGEIENGIEYQLWIG